MEQPEKRAGRPPRVKNKNAADIQITAEQILREATERTETALRPPKQKIADGEELADYRLRKRKDFEDTIRRNRLNIGAWLKYATWEESQKEFDRSRSIFERCLDVDRRNVGVWLKYIEMEVKNKNINHARNLFDHAITTLPRVDQFWYKFTYMEEMLGNIANARQIFERWMQWEPDESAWSAYIKMEKRYGEIDRARAIYERFVSIHPEPKNWLKWSKFEEEQNNLERVREIFDQAIETLGEDHMDQRVFVAFAKFETKVKEFERARVIYKYALDRLPRSKSEVLYKQYTQFEKQYGDKEGIEDVIITKRRTQYEQDVTENPRNYDVWFDYARLEESGGDPSKVREVYERAIANIPPVEEKRFWRRYMYLWIYYALYEELEAKDYERTRQVYKQCISLIPHKKFTFAKTWLLYAKFEIRRRKLGDARKALGTAIGMCPKRKLFAGYIELETQLVEFDRCRQLYMKQLEYDPTSCAAWKSFADLEKTLGDIPRARGIFELAVEQPSLDMPETLWKAYIDFEISQHEYEKTRVLYERLLQRTEHFKVWISYAHFEFSAPSAKFIEEHDLDDEDEDELPEPDAEELVDRCRRSREIFARADRRAKERDVKDERVCILEAWRDFENAYGTEETKDAISKKMPKKVKRRRRVDGGSDANGVAWEEYFDYLFPDEQGAKPNLKLLAMAHAWAKKKAAGINEPVIRKTNVAISKTDDENDQDDENENDNDDESKDGDEAEAEQNEDDENRQEEENGEKDDDDNQANETKRKRSVSADSEDRIEEEREDEEKRKLRKRG